MNTSNTNAADRGAAQVRVTEIRLHFVEDGKDRLLAWASCVLNDTVVLNSIAVRHGREGGLILTYPAKLTASGTRFYYFNPINRDAADAVERAIIAKIRELSGVGCSGESAAVENG